MPRAFAYLHFPTEHSHSLGGRYRLPQFIAKGSETQKSLIALAEQLSWLECCLDMSRLWVRSLVGAQEESTNVAGRGGWGQREESTNEYINKWEKQFSVSLFLSLLLYEKNQTIK